MSRIISNIRIVLFLVSVTFFSIFIFPGYGGWTWDFHFYLPPILNKIDPSLLNHDLILSFNQLNYSYFDEIIVFLIRVFHADLFHLLFFLSVLYRFLLYLSIFALAKYFSKNNVYCFLCVLFFLSGYRIFGTGFYTLDEAVVARSISVAIGLLGMASMLHKRNKLAFVLIILTIFLHGITTIPLFLIFGVQLIRQHTLSKGVRKFFFVCAGVGLFLGVFFFSDFLFKRIDRNWERIIRLGDPFFFLADWNRYALEQTLITLVLLWIGMREYGKKALKKLHPVSTMLAVPVILCIGEYALGDMLKFHLPVELQFYRSIYLVKVITVVLFGWYVFESAALREIGIVEKTAGAGILLSFLFKHAFLIGFPIEESIVYLFFPLFVVLYWGRTFNLKNPLFAILSLLSIGITYGYMRLYDLRMVLFVLVGSVAFISMHVRRLSLYLLLILFAEIWMYQYPGFGLQRVEKSDESFSLVCKWFSDHTTPDMVILTEPYVSPTISSLVRIGCARNVYVSRYDSTQSVFNRAYAVEWEERMNRVNKIRERSDFMQISNQLPVDFILAEKRYKFPVNPAFFSNEYAIYDLRNHSVL